MNVKFFAALLIFGFLPATNPAGGQPATTPVLERHEFVVRNFKTESGTFVRLEEQIAALTMDSAWQGGDYLAPPTKGLEAFSTDLYFPITDARYEQSLIPHVTFTPIPSLWGHTAGAASNPADLKFLNQNIAAFLKLQ